MLFGIDAALLSDVRITLLFLIKLFVCEALVFEAGPTEVDEQSDLNIVSLEIVDRLSKVNWFKHGLCLELNRDQILYQKIAPSCSKL